MRRPGLQWLIAVLLTLASAYWQRVSGPTYPVKGEVRLAGETIPLRLDRSHGGPDDQPVRVVVKDAGVRVDVLWRRYPSSDTWQVLPMQRAGEALETALPHQPPAGKLEYQLRFVSGEERVAFPERPAVTRFKGDVSPIVLAPHILSMFLSLLMTARAALAALAGADVRRWAWAAIGLLCFGGFVLGPIVQWQADAARRARVAGGCVAAVARPARPGRRALRGRGDPGGVRHSPQRLGLADRLVEAVTGGPPGQTGRASRRSGLAGGGTRSLEGEKRRDGPASSPESSTKP